MKKLNISKETVKAFEEAFDISNNIKWTGHNYSPNSLFDDTYDAIQYTKMIEAFAKGIGEIK